MPESVSIITPAYNSSKFIGYTIQSVVDQTFTDWELIIVDDCSVDDTYQLAKKHGENDKRIRLFQNPQNSGPAISRNRAIEKAKGRYIAFLDSDDLWHPQKLEKQVRFMETNGYLFTFTGYEKMEESGIKTGQLAATPKKLSYHDLLKSNQIGCLTAMYNAEHLGKMYMPSIRARQDYALWLDILKKIPYAYSLPESLAYYRMRTRSVSSSKMKLLKYNWKLYRNIEGFSGIESAYYLCWNIWRKLTE